MKIEYLSALPGSGKTTWILRHMKENKSSKRSIIVYAAPTKLLLRQVQDDLYTNHGIHAEMLVKERGDRNLIEQKIDDFLYQALVGDILLITHEALLHTKNKWCNSDRIELIVDEQMSLIREIPKQFQPQIGLKLWDELFCPVKLKVFSEITIKKGKYEETLEFRRRKRKDEETLDTLTLKFLDWVLDRSCEVFARCTKGKRYMKISSVSIISTKVFTNVNRVILVGAFLDSTEMFHVLKHDGHDLVPLKEDAGLRDVSHRFSKLHIYPLFARKTMISKNARSLPVCPKQFFDHIKKLWYKESKFLSNEFFKDSKKAISKRRETNEMCKRLGKPLKELSDWDKYFESENKSVIDYFLHVWKTHPLFGLDECSPTLLAANRDVLDEQQQSLPLHHYSKLLSPKSHGLNAYTDYCRIAYFATMLPTPSRGQFYKDILEGYSSKEWTINALAQSVTRTAVRNPDSNAVVNVLVPDFECAIELKKKFENKPKCKRLDIFGDYQILETLLSKKSRKQISADYYQRNKERLKEKQRQRYAKKKLKSD